MEIQAKYEAYKRLIEEVKASYDAHSTEQTEQKIHLQWCDDCKEINLWTYWQGRGHLDARIMLVGQDWGCPWDKNTGMVMRNIRAMNDGVPVHYMASNDSPTDRNLVRLFDAIGYNILSDDDKNNEELFFTNLVLGYRNKGTSGGLKKEWIQNDLCYFKRLANIIEPELIICLGRDTFEGALDAFGFELNPVIKGFNDFLTSDQNPVALKLDSGKTVKIAAVAHCGVLGTFNRNDKKNRLLDKQIEDWKRIMKKTTETHYDFFQNRECEYFPCHAGADRESFSCLFCYCPLYALGDKCGGSFRYLDNGIKDCSGCLRPHRRENYGAIMDKMPQVIELAKKP